MPLGLKKILLRAEDYHIDSMDCCKGAVLCEMGNSLSLEVMLATDFMPTFPFIKVIACSTLKWNFQVETGKLMEAKTSLEYSSLKHKFLHFTFIAVCLGFCYILIPYYLGTLLYDPSS